MGPRLGPLPTEHRGQGRPVSPTSTRKTATDSVSGSSGVQPYNLSHGGTDLAVLGEISLLARYRVTDCLWLRAGYQFYYAAGLATGPRQLGGFDNGGDVGLDGLSLGVEYMR